MAPGHPLHQLTVGQALLQITEPEANVIFGIASETMTQAQCDAVPGNDTRWRSEVIRVLAIEARMVSLGEYGGTLRQCVRQRDKRQVTRTAPLTTPNICTLLWACAVPTRHAAADIIIVLYFISVNSSC